MSTATNKTPEELIAAVATPTPDGKVWQDAACHCHAVEFKVLFSPLYPPFEATAESNRVLPWNMRAGAEESEGGGKDGEPAPPSIKGTTSSREAPLCMLCNCSVCVKNGYVLIYPRRAEVVFTKGWETLKNYEFATCTRDHKFCPNCGSSVLIDFRGTVLKEDILGVNARMLKDFDFDKLSFERGAGRTTLSPQFNDQYS